MSEVKSLVVLLRLTHTHRHNLKNKNNTQKEKDVKVLKNNSGNFAHVKSLHSEKQTNPGRTSPRSEERIAEEGHPLLAWFGDDNHSEVLAAFVFIKGIKHLPWNIWEILRKIRESSNIQCKSSNWILTKLDGKFAKDFRPFSAFLSNFVDEFSKPIDFRKYFQNINKKTILQEIEEYGVNILWIRRRVDSRSPWKYSAHP